jgi:hypothetical protein
MPATTDYLATLKIQLDAAAANKKAALDAAYERATNVVFDKDGKMSTRKTPAGNDAGPGTLDVQYAEQQRNIGSSNEASGTLKSGQYGRELATSQAGYRSTIAGLNAERISGQTAADTDAATEYAKYKAMYGEPTADPTPTTGGGSGGGGGGGGGSGIVKKPKTPTDVPITAPPVFTEPGTPNIIPESTYTNMTPEQKAAVISRTGAVDANGRSGMGASAPTTIPQSTYTNMTPQQKAAVITRNDAVDAKGRSGMGASAPKAVIPQNKQVTSPVTKKPVVTPPKKLKPVGAWDR